MDQQAADRGYFHFADLNATKYERDVSWWDGAFTFDDVQKIKALGMELPEHPGETSGDSGDTEHVRRCTVRWFENNEKTAWVYDRLRGIAKDLNAQYFGFDLWGFEVFQFTTYDAERNSQTEYYDWHVDMRGQPSAGQHDIWCADQLAGWCELRPQVHAGFDAAHDHMERSVPVGCRCGPGSFHGLGGDRRHFILV